MNGLVSARPEAAIDAPRRDAAPLQMLLCVVGLVTAVLFVWPLFAIDRFDYPHAWVSAHFATMARSFAEHGAAALGFVPVQNNPPLTSEPDFYIHWPPFASLFLGWLFSALRSDSEWVVHASSLSLVALQAALLFVWLRNAVSLTAAAWGTLLFLNAPVVAKYGHVWLHLHLALLLALAAFLLYHRAMLRPDFEGRTLALGCALYALACFTTWEPILALPGLAMYAVVLRSRRSLLGLAAYTAAGALTVLGTFALYAHEVDGLATRLIARALFRAGMADFSIVGDPPLHEFANLSPERAMSWVDVAVTWGDRLSLLGVIGLCALISLLVQLVGKGARSAATRTWLVLAPLLAMWVLWFLLMPQHAFIHEYQIVLGALPVALAGGFVADHLGRRAAPSARTNTVLRAAAMSVPVLLVLLRLPLDYQKYRAFHPETNDLIHLGLLLRDKVPENGIVTVPWYDMVPTYYSRVHLVRGITDAAMVRDHLGALRALCDSCSYYAVLQSGAGAEALPGRVIWQDDRWRLVALGTTLGDAGAGAAR